MDDVTDCLPVAEAAGWGPGFDDVFGGSATPEDAKIMNRYTLELKKWHAEARRRQHRSHRWISRRRARVAGAVGVREWSGKGTFGFSAHYAGELRMRRREFMREICGMRYVIVHTEPRNYDMLVSARADIAEALALVKNQDRTRLSIGVEDDAYAFVFDAVSCSCYRFFIYKGVVVPLDTDEVVAELNGPEFTNDNLSFIEDTATTCESYARTIVGANNSYFVKKLGDRLRSYFNSGCVVTSVDCCSVNCDAGEFDAFVAVNGELSTTKSESNSLFSQLTHRMYVLDFTMPLLKQKPVELAPATKPSQPTPKKG